MTLSLDGAAFGNGGPCVREGIKKKDDGANNGKDVKAGIMKDPVAYEFQAVQQLQASFGNRISWEAIRVVFEENDRSFSESYAQLKSIACLGHLGNDLPGVEHHLQQLFSCLKPVHRVLVSNKTETLLRIKCRRVHPRLENEIAGIVAAPKDDDDHQLATQSSWRLVATKNDTVYSMVFVASLPRLGTS